MSAATADPDPAAAPMRQQEARANLENLELS
jgi:hypothetical protein